ncbi:glycosyltransferase family 39 protein [Candidatus Saccharibacteria bacterium]|nr:glycosyltransferase family 39 protein [Candidatus Saccharibacteria bacterium]
MIKLKKINRVLVFEVVFSAIIATLFVLFLSFSTSPLYSEYYGGDSAQFQTIGKIWANGGIPYRDAFDHKGPIIFLANAIGYTLTGNRFGVALIQAICIFATLITIFKICKLASTKPYYGVIGVILTLIFLSLCYTDGNMTEEYCLPFIALSFYGLTKYFIYHKKHKIIEHSLFWAMVYGLCFGVCLMSQATNALPIGIGTLIIGIFLLCKKQWKNLLQNIACCIGGTIAVVLPFIIYFAINNSLGDFFYCTIGYNSEYATNMASWLLHSNGETFANMSIILFPSYTMLLAGYLAWKRREHLYSIFLIVCGTIEVIWFCMGASFAQYEMITVPQIVLVLNELLLTKKSNESQIFQTFILSFIAIICFNQIQNILISIPNGYRNYNQKPNTSQDIEALINSIPEIDKDSFIAYGGNSLKDIYLRQNLTPYYKFFSIQDWHSKFSAKIKEEIYDTFSNGNVTWILTDKNPIVIDDVLKSHYDLTNKQGDYYLYKIKDK